MDTSDPTSPGLFPHECREPEPGQVESGSLNERVFFEENQLVGSSAAGV